MIIPATSTAVFVVNVRPFQPFFCSMPARYNHDIPVPSRPQGFTGFPVIASAEISFIRQIQKLMFDVYEEHVSLAASQMGLQEVCVVHSCQIFSCFCVVYVLIGLLQHIASPFGA